MKVKKAVSGAGPIARVPSEAPFGPCAAALSHRAANMSTPFWFATSRFIAPGMSWTSDDGHG